MRCIPSNKNRPWWYFPLHSDYRVHCLYEDTIHHGKGSRALQFSEGLLHPVISSRSPWYMEHRYDRGFTFLTLVGHSRLHRFLLGVNISLEPWELSPPTLSKMQRPGKHAMSLMVLAISINTTFATTIPSYGQCGGSGFTATGDCASGFNCQSQNTFYCALQLKPDGPLSMRSKHC